MNNPYRVEYLPGDLGINMMSRHLNIWNSCKNVDMTKNMTIKHNIAISTLFILMNKTFFLT